MKSGQHMNIRLHKNIMISVSLDPSQIIDEARIFKESIKSHFLGHELIYLFIERGNQDPNTMGRGWISGKSIIKASS